MRGVLDGGSARHKCVLGQGRRGWGACACQCYVYPCPRVQVCLFDDTCVIMHMPWFKWTAVLGMKHRGEMVLKHSLLFSAAACLSANEVSMYMCTVLCYTDSVMHIICLARLSCSDVFGVNAGIRACSCYPRGPPLGLPRHD